MESPELFNERVLSEREVDVYNGMQTALMLNSAGPDDRNNHAMKWVEENAEAFEKEFAKMLSENPDLVDSWSDRSQEFIGEMEKKLEERRLNKAA